MSHQERNMTRPGSAIVVAALVMIEAVAVLIYAVSYLVNLSTDGTVNIGGQIFMLVLCLLVAVWQGSVAINFYKGKAFTRAPIIVWQLFQLILSISFLSTDILLVKLAAVLAMAVAGVCIVMLFAPKTTAFLGDRPSR
ncbi:hypothetical protein [Glutamicibacter sp. JC586]|uniref:hypothetical protein n=1 Tax=Glutamicibacter sp. JC586 TaxID=2590552 RepID=UPI0013571059|nr:hypothetical protein [Glutamicibacter sp. JC586]